MTPVNEIDHIGIAVKSIAGALPFYTDQLGMKLMRRETVAHQFVEVAMLDAGASRIELLEATSPASPIARFLESRGPGLHHVAMRTADLRGAVARLEADGARVIGEPKPGAGGHLCVFIHPHSAGGVLWEIIQA